MVKRIISIICIMFLLFTATVPLSGGVFSYAESEGLDDQQKAALAISSYFNYRKGWYAGSAVGAVSLMKSYIDDFFTDSANTTGINSYSDFVSHVSVGKNSSGNWGVTIDNTGLVFLDHLCKWLLGKDKFPNLYSGGTWGNSNSTTDPVYSGAIIGSTLCYVITPNSTLHNTVYNNFTPSQFEGGTTVHGYTPDYIVSQYESAINASLDFNSTSSSPNYPAQDITFDYFSDVSITYNIDFQPYYNTSSAMKNYIPSLLLTVGLPYPNGSEGRTWGNIIYTSRANYVAGQPAFILEKLNDNSNPGNYIKHYYCGFVFHNRTTDRYCFYLNTEVFKNDYPNDIQNGNVNLDTDNFDKNDVGQADANGTPEADAPSKTFTPKYTNNEGDTYNYYNEETYETVNNFYNEYIYNYTYNTNNEYNNTIIDNSDGSDDPGDEPETPGGTTPPWDSSSGSGTLTPDGNGGYNFNLPDLTIPDLNIDWSINGLKEKFPFSIPWDLLAFFTVLNAEPETPAIQAQIDLGIVDWDIDWNLHQFDNIAALLRNLEFIGFCLALILITRSIIKG